MKAVIYKNTANIIVIFRIILVFIIIAMLSVKYPSLNYIALFLIVIAALLDALDGITARKMKIASDVGGLLDTLGDRLTENLLMVFYAYMRILPLNAALIFITRSFVADFIRHLNYLKGMSTFAVNRSGTGYYLVASVVSRSLYLALKILLFLSAGWIVTLNNSAAAVEPFLEKITISLVYIVVVFSVIRLVLLVYDSRESVKEYFF